VLNNKSIGNQEIVIKRLHVEEKMNISLIYFNLVNIVYHLSYQIVIINNNYVIITKTNCIFTTYETILKYLMVFILISDLLW